MRKTYLKPTVHVHCLQTAEIMAASLTGTNVNDALAPTNATGLSKSFSIWDTEDTDEWGCVKSQILA